MELSFTQVDAFADRPFAGNPAAVIPLDEWLDDDLLQAIAAENNLSETAFTVPADGEADFDLRWFTPSTEVVLCGRATLASGHVLMGPRERVRFSTRHSGVLEVSRVGEASEHRYELSLPALAPEPRPMPDTAEALGVKARETLYHPDRYAVLLVDSEQIVRDCAPDFRRLAAIGDTLTIVTAPGAETDVVSRVFAAGAGIDEDPVTGSAHAVLTPYWAKRLGRGAFSAFQASGRGGHLDCRLDADRVVLGGRCVTVIEGSFFV